MARVFIREPGRTAETTACGTRCSCEPHSTEFGTHPETHGLHRKISRAKELAEIGNPPPTSSCSPAIQPRRQTLGDARRYAGPRSGSQDVDPDRTDAGRGRPAQGIRGRALNTARRAVAGQSPTAAKHGRRLAPLGRTQPGRRPPSVHALTRHTAPVAGRHHAISQDLRGGSLCRRQVIHHRPRVGDIVFLGEHQEVDPAQQARCWGREGAFVEDVVTDARRATFLWSI